jgi:hypothetical protein
MRFPRRGVTAARAVSSCLLTATALLCSAFTVNTSHAADQSERLVYNIMVGGLHIGDSMIGLKQSPAGYSTEMRLTAKGVAKWVRDFRSDMRGEGSFGESVLKPVPASFTRQWSNGEIAADMKMTFDPATREALTEERYFNPETATPIAREDLPWFDKDDRRQKPVPPDMRIGVLDPMAAFVAARSQILAQGIDGKTAKTFRVATYDGRRRYDVVGRAEPARMVEIGGVSRSVIPVIAKLEPVFGFGRKSQERMKDSEGKFLFSNDARFIPLQLVISNDMLSGVMNLAADCSSDPAPCDTFGQQKSE